MKFFIFSTQCFDFKFFRLSEIEAKTVLHMLGDGRCPFTTFTLDEATALVQHYRTSFELGTMSEPFSADMAGGSSDRLVCRNYSTESPFSLFVSPRGDRARMWIESDLSKGAWGDGGVFLKAKARIK